METATFSWLLKYQNIQCSFWHPPILFTMLSLFTDGPEYQKRVDTPFTSSKVHYLSLLVDININILV